MSERTPLKSGSSRGSTASASSTGYQHHSAPNSPVLKRQHSNTHRSKPSKILQVSNSMINNSNLINHFNNNMTINNNSSSSINTSNDALTTSASISKNQQNGNSITKPIAIKHSTSKSPITVSSSPTSSLSSTSEMNILQELQQHALFKLPMVDRSVSPLNPNFSFLN